MISLQIIQPKDKCRANNKFKLVFATVTVDSPGMSFF